MEPNREQISGTEANHHITVISFEYGNDTMESEPANLIFMCRFNGMFWEIKDRSVRIDILTQKCHLRFTSLTEVWNRRNEETV